MDEIRNALFMAVLALNLFALGSGRLQSVIRIVAAQGVILGILPLLVEPRIHVPVILSSAAAMALKGVVIPAIMLKALRDVKIKREVETFIGLLPSAVLGAVATALVFIVYGYSGASGGGRAELAIPTSIATILAGFILLTTRYKAISQVLGYLILENGIYIFGLLLLEAVPMVIEMGMLLDLFVSVFIVSIITNHINQAFSSLDTRKLSTLKE